LPSINALARDLDRDGLTVLLIDLAEDRAIVERAVKSRGYTARVLLDADREVSSAYAVRATPIVYLVGRDGTLRARALGPRPWTGPDGRALFRSLLGERHGG
jgi:hypothetical protein